MRVAIVHPEVGPQAPADEQDVLIQAEAVFRALEELGHSVISLPCTLDLERMRQNLMERGVEVVFNLVETLEGTGRLIHLFPALLDVMGLPYTGSPSLSLLLTSHKLLAKERLKAAGFPTPPWIGPFPVDGSSVEGLSGGEKGEEGPWIIKSLWEHASVGLDETSVAWGTWDQVKDRLPQKASLSGGSCFAERFVEGREFNVSLLATPQGPQVLPPAEILFQDFEPGDPRMVGYQAKWDASSEAYQKTPRQFGTLPQHAPLIQSLSDLALQCWDLFSLRGYARVDFRVDEQDRPWILEVNTNPCLSPDAGFAAALQQAGIPFVQAIKGILLEAIQ